LQIKFCMNPIEQLYAVGLTKFTFVQLHGTKLQEPKY
jgi:hypothetical protein